MIRPEAAGILYGGPTSMPSFAPAPPTQLEAAARQGLPSAAAPSPLACPSVK